MRVGLIDQALVVARKRVNTRVTYLTPKSC